MIKETKADETNSINMLGHAEAPMWEDSRKVSPGAESEIFFSRRNTQGRKPLSYGGNILPIMHQWKVSSQGPIFLLREWTPARSLHSDGDLFRAHVRAVLISEPTFLWCPTIWAVLDLVISYITLIQLTSKGGWIFNVSLRETCFYSATKNVYKCPQFCTYLCIGLITIHKTYSLTHFNYFEILTYEEH